MNTTAFTLSRFNAKGTGSTVRLQLLPAETSQDGGLLLVVSPQCSDNPETAMISVKIDFEIICHILQVLRGETEDINNGKGVFFSDTKTSLRFRHIVDPVGGYALELYRDNRAVSFFLTPGEALGISCAIEASMGKIVFGM